MDYGPWASTKGWPVQQELLLGHNLIETTQLTITDLKGAHERIHLREKQSAIV